MVAIHPRLTPWAAFWRRFAAGFGGMRPLLCGTGRLSYRCTYFRCDGRGSFSRRLLLLLLFLAGLTAPLLAQSWRIANFEDTISISADGSTLVKERINLVFIGEWHGIHRTIPIEYPGPQGTNYTLFLDVVSVTDGAGQKLKYESKTSGGYRDLKIYIPGAVDTTRTVEIDYIVHNGIRYFEATTSSTGMYRQRLAGSHRSRGRPGLSAAERCRGVTSPGFHRGLRIGPARRHHRNQGRRRRIREHQSAPYARRNDD